MCRDTSRLDKRSQTRQTQLSIHQNKNETQTKVNKPFKRDKPKSRPPPVQNPNTQIEQHSTIGKDVHFYYILCIIIHVININLKPLNYNVT